MKARLLWMSTFFFVFGLAIQARAEDNNRPDRYQPLTTAMLKKQSKRAEQGNLTPQDIQVLSAQIHNISIKDVPTSQTDGRPTTVYLQGEDFKLNAVYSGN